MMMTNRSTRRGFTLAEILLAMGILGIGMIMVAAAFPTAIAQSRASYDETLSTLIAENAQAMIVAKLRSGDNIPAGPLVRLDDPGAGKIDLFEPIDRKFIDPADKRSDPNGDAADRMQARIDSRYGWLLLGRAGGTNDFQFVVVPVAGFPGLPAVLTEEKVEIDDAQYTARFTDEKNIAIGSPVILQGSGRFVFVVGTTTDNGNRVALLSGPMGVAKATYDVFVVPGSGFEAPSPALGAYVFRTSLRP